MIYFETSLTRPQCSVYAGHLQVCKRPKRAHIYLSRRLDCFHPSTLQCKGNLLHVPNSSDPVPFTNASKPSSHPRPQLRRLLSRNTFESPMAHLGQCSQCFIYSTSKLDPGLGYVSDGSRLLWFPCSGSLRFWRADLHH